MNHVFVVNVSGHDLSPAQKFGQLVFCTSGKDYNIFDISQMTEDLKFTMKDIKEGDYVLLCGAPVLNVVAAGIPLKRHGFVNVLIFDAKTREYMPRTITNLQLGA